MGRACGPSDEQLRALDRLSKVVPVREFYLAGGTAIALHLGHRRSMDLDLFSKGPVVDLAALKLALGTSFDRVEVVGETDASLRLLCDGLPVDFVKYPYAPLNAPAPTDQGVDVAGLVDLGVMKLSAIARRGLRRDFWDLVAILDSGLSLSALGVAYRQRFGVAESDLYHVARSLTYFDDAEKDPVLPAGMTASDWDRIKARLRAEAPTLVS